MKKKISIFALLGLCFAVVAYLGQGCAEKFDSSVYVDGASVTPTPDPAALTPRFTNQSPAANVPVGLAQLVLFVTIENKDVLLHQIRWFKDGALVKSSTEATLTITNVQLANAGTYTANYLADNGYAVTSAPIVVQVYVPAGNPLNCVAKAVSWTVGGNVCGNTAPDLLNLATATVNYNSAVVGGTVGTAQFQCVDGLYIEQAGATCKKILPPLASAWVSFLQACPAGYISAQLEDDNDANHNVGEGGGGSGLKLCVQGVEAVTWSTTCPAGYVDTGLVDDTNGVHKISEQNKDGADVRYCVKGIQSANFAATCAANQHWFGQIWDNADSVHRLYEDGTGDNNSLRFCWTPLP